MTEKGLTMEKKTALNPSWLPTKKDGAMNLSPAVMAEALRLQRARFREGAQVWTLASAKYVGRYMTPRTVKGVMYDADGVVIAASLLDVPADHPTLPQTKRRTALQLPASAHTLRYVVRDSYTDLDDWSDPDGPYRGTAVETCMGALIAEAAKNVNDLELLRKIYGQPSASVPEAPEVPEAPLPEERSPAADALARIAHVAALHENTAALQENTATMLKFIATVTAARVSEPHQTFIVGDVQGGANDVPRPSDIMSITCCVIAITPRNGVRVWPDKWGDMPADAAPIWLARGMIRNTEELETGVVDLLLTRTIAADKGLLLAAPPSAQPRPRPRRERPLS
jgi:hypothetical protein